jgi:F-box-like
MAAYKARLSPAMHESSADTGNAGQFHAAPLPEQTLLSISSDAREAVLAHLNAAELCQCQLVCRALRTAAAADSLWRQLCARTWPQTDAAAWLSPSIHGGFQYGKVDDATISNYRQLYPALLRFDSFVGVWREPTGETPSLYCFRWGRGCIEGSRLTYSVGPGGPQASLLRRIFDDNGVIQIEHLTATECTLAMPPPMPLHKSPSQEAQAAAAVANNRVWCC